MLRPPLLSSFLILFFFIFSLTFNLFDSSFASLAMADEKKIIKKNKKITIKKKDGKITIKKSFKKVVKKRDSDKDRDDDRGGKGLPKQIRKLQAQINALQNELDNIQLTPGPQGEPGPAGPQGPAGNDGADGATVLQAHRVPQAQRDLKAHKAQPVATTMPMEFKSPLRQIFLKVHPLAGLTSMD